MPFKNTLQDSKTAMYQSIIESSNKLMQLVRAKKNLKKLKSDRICQFEKVCFKKGFEGEERTAEGSRHHGGLAGRWCSELDGRRGSESEGG